MICSCRCTEKKGCPGTFKRGDGLARGRGVQSTSRFRTIVCVVGNSDDKRIVCYWLLLLFNDTFCYYLWSPLSSLSLF